LESKFKEGNEQTLFSNFQKCLFYNSRFEWMDLELIKSVFKVLDPLWKIEGFTYELEESLSTNY